MSSHNRKSAGSRKKLIAGISALVIAALAIFLGFQYMSPTASSSNGIKSALTTKKASTYKVSDEEKSYLKNKFDGLTATNPDTISNLTSSSMTKEPSQAVTEVFLIIRVHEDCS